MTIAANFKACMTRGETRSYFDALHTFLRANPTKSDVLVFTPASCFDRFGEGATLGAQNAFPVSNGAYTGETALDQLNEFSIQTILIGHSERRQILHESQEQVATKFDFFAKQGFKIVYCIGEPLAVKQQGVDAVLSYLEKEFVGIDTGYENMVIAYEPIWAIGTGLTPSNEEIETILATIKQKYGHDVLYGGSVKAGNSKEILALESCDGVLVGSAALEVEDFSTMILNSNN